MAIYHANQLDIDGGVENGGLTYMRLSDGWYELQWEAGPFTNEAMQEMFGNSHPEIDFSSEVK